MPDREQGKIRIVFNRYPGGPEGPLVDIEIDGKSVQFGRWIELEGGQWALEFPKTWDQEIDNLPGWTGWNV